MINTSFLPTRQHKALVRFKHQFFSNDKSFILTGSDLAYLAAFFNSSLFKFAFKDYFPELLGDTRELRKVFFENVSVIPAIDSAWFEAQIDRIISLKNRNMDTANLEAEIDDRFFDIYDLTASERELIRISSKEIAASDFSISNISSLERA